MQSGVSETQPRVCRDGAVPPPKKLSAAYLTCSDPFGASAVRSQKEGLTRSFLLSLFFSFVECFGNLMMIFISFFPFFFFLEEMPAAAGTHPQLFDRCYFTFCFSASSPGT